MSAERTGLQERDFFSRQEYVEAHALILPRARAEQFVDECVLAPVPIGAESFHGYLGDDTLDLLSLLNRDCAERVRRLRGEDAEQAMERMREFSARTGLHARR
jgi:hypothetical protein